MTFGELQAYFVRRREATQMNDSIMVDPRMSDRLNGRPYSMPGGSDEQSHDTHGIIAVHMRSRINPVCFFSESCRLQWCSPLISSHPFRPCSHHRNFTLAGAFIAPLPHTPPSVTLASTAGKNGCVRVRRSRTPLVSI